MLSLKQLTWLAEQKPEPTKEKCVQHIIPNNRICIDLAREYGQVPLEEEFDWLYQER